MLQWLWCIWPLMVSSFNLDLQSAWLLHDTKDPRSYFGFSVAVHIDKDNAWLYAGAPKAQTRWPGLPRAGRAYRCNPLRYANCFRVPTPEKAQNEKSDHRVPNDRTEQWMGQTVVATSINGTGAFAICAPRFIFKAPDSALQQDAGLNGGEERQRTWAPIGECVLYTGHAASYQVVSPCRSISLAEQSQCQAGFSADLSGFYTANGQIQLYFLAGLPGSYVAEGDVYFAVLANGKMENEWTFHGQSSADPALKRQRQQQDKESYLGYTTKFAWLKSDSKKRGDSSVLAARPMWRPNQARGAVFISDKYMSRTVILNDTHGHLGSYFGYSLTSADFDGDGMGDIVVGAPYHVNREAKRSSQVDVGCVYIYYGESQLESDQLYQISSQMSLLEGSTNRGRFGTSLANIGDLDDDGIEDLAVGCPFCGPHGRGQVFIYFGDQERPQYLRPAQTISAEELVRNKPPDSLFPKSFGWSLAGGEDIDFNGVPDLVVGAYSSAHVAVIRGRPVVRLFIPLDQIRLPRIVRADNCASLQTNCSFDLRFTWYSRVKIGPLEQQPAGPLQFRFLYDLDSLVKSVEDKRIHRAVEGDTIFEEIIDVSSWNTVSGLSEVQTLRHHLSVREVQRKGDVVTPIRISFRIEPLWPQHGEEATVQQRAPKLQAALHPTSPRIVQMPDIDIYKAECGEDNVCHPDLRLTLNDMHSMVGSLWYGEQQRPRPITAIIMNRGEPAFGANFTLNLPRGVAWLDYQVELNADLRDHVQNTRLARILCDERVLTDSTIQVRCDLPNPLPTLHGQQAILLHFNVSAAQRLSVNSTSGDAFFSLNALIESQNVERLEHKYDNEATLHFQIKLASQLRLSSRTDNEGYLDGRKVAIKPNAGEPLELDKLGLHFTHRYQLTNRGPSPARMIQINITVPLYTNNGDELVYILPHAMISTEAAERSTTGSQKQEMLLLPRVVSLTGAIRTICQIDARYINPLKLSAFIGPRAATKVLPQPRDLSVTLNKQYLHRARRNVLQDNDTIVLSSSENSQSRSIFNKDNNGDLVKCGKRSRLFGKLKCALITCLVENMERDETVDVLFDGILWAQTAFSYHAQEIQLFTEAVAAVNQPPSGLSLSETERGAQRAEIGQRFVFKGIRITVLKSMPVWAIVLAVVLGIFLLAIIIVSLWKCGFFKRRQWETKAAAL